MKNEILEKRIGVMRAIVEVRVENYKSDFYRHDIEWMKEKPDTPFIWIVRESGTHIYPFSKAIDLPAKGERVPYLFGKATREEIAQGEIDTITRCFGFGSSISPSCDFYKVEGYSVKPITKIRAIHELTEHYSKEGILTND